MRTGPTADPTAGTQEDPLRHLKLPELFFSFQELELCKLYEARLQQDPPVHDLQGTQARRSDQLESLTKEGH